MIHLKFISVLHQWWFQNRRQRARQFGSSHSHSFWVFEWWLILHRTSSTVLKLRLPYSKLRLPYSNRTRSASIHLNRNGLLLTFVSSPTTQRDSHHSNKNIRPITGTSGNTLLLSIRLPWPILLYTPIIIQQTFAPFKIHLKHQTKFTIYHICKFFS